MDAKKKNVSLRMSHQDIDKIQHIAKRLDVKEVDIIRFAVKQMLNSLAPFQEQAYKGLDLMPALLEVGSDLASFFELSSEELDRIVNTGIQDNKQRIDVEDLRLLALFGVNEQYARMTLESRTKEIAANGCAEEVSLKEYLVSKYFRQATTRKHDREANWLRAAIPSAATTL